MKNLQESIRNDINKLNEATHSVNHPIREGDAIKMLEDIFLLLGYWLDGAPDTPSQTSREFFVDHDYSQLNEIYYDLQKIIVRVANIATDENQRDYNILKGIGKIVD